MPHLSTSNPRELDHFNRQMEACQKAAWELVLFDSEGKMFALEEAAELIGAFTEREKLDAIFLNHSFERCRDYLIQGLQKGAGEEKELYFPALKNLARAYLEAVAFAGPEVWGPYTRFCISATKNLFRQWEQLDFDALLGQWLAQLEKDEASLLQLRSSLSL